MSTFIIRSQGFFYTDEYYAPGETFRQVVKKKFTTKKAADTACGELIRKWVRAEPLGNYLFDDGEAISAVLEYMNEQWPEDDIRWDSELEIPSEATDKQVDEIVKRMDVTFAQVFEVDEEPDDDDADDDDDDEASYEDELHFGPR
jgi:hypothetical protein